MQRGAARWTGGKLTIRPAIIENHPDRVTTRRHLTVVVGALEGLRSVEDNEDGKECTNYLQNHAGSVVMIKVEAWSGT